MAGIWWLASYPKSGNTWMRAFLANLLRGKSVGINEMGFLGYHAAKTSSFDMALGVEGSDLEDDVQAMLRPALYGEWAAEAREDIFCKTHDCYGPTPAGEPLFPAACTRGAVCIVRNPLDIVPSWAHHFHISLDRTIRDINNPELRMHSDDRIFQNMSEHRGSWSSHIASWFDAPFPVCRVRYEDMLEQPLATFTAVTRFLGLPHGEEAVARAVADVAFDRLRQQDEEQGFNERLRRNTVFFRQGRAGGWREVLSPEQAAAVIAAHAPMMAHFGYPTSDDR